MTKHPSVKIAEEAFPGRKATRVTPMSGAWRTITRFEFEELKAKGENVDWIEGAGYIVYDAQALAETQEQARQVAVQRSGTAVEPMIGKCARCSRDVAFSDIYLCRHEHCYYRTGNTEAVK